MFIGKCVGGFEVMNLADDFVLAIEVVNDLVGIQIAPASAGWSGTPAATMNFVASEVSEAGDVMWSVFTSPLTLPCPADSPLKDGQHVSSCL
jgi:hypothetical protein